MALLEVAGLELNYGQARAVRGVTLSVDAGEVVTLIGANGAGKTTTLKGIVGLLRAAAGQVSFAGASTSGRRADWLARNGLNLVPEGRHVFPGLTVAQNLDVAATASKLRGHQLKEAIGEVYDVFPRLRERSGQLSWTLSGGEQQMLAVGRALIARPRVLLLDEPSLGLSPKLASEVVTLISRYSREHGLAVLLVEQNAVLALGVSDRGYVIEHGRIVASGQAQDLLNSTDVQQAYLGG